MALYPREGVCLIRSVIGQETFTGIEASLFLCAHIVVKARQKVPPTQIGMLVIMLSASRRSPEPSPCWFAGRRSPAAFHGSFRLDVEYRGIVKDPVQGTQQGVILVVPAVNEVEEQPGILLVELTVTHLVNNQAGRTHQAIECRCFLTGSSCCSELVLNPATLCQFDIGGGKPILDSSQPHGRSGIQEDVDVINCIQDIADSSAAFSRCPANNNLYVRWDP